MRHDQSLTYKYMWAQWVKVPAHRALTTYQILLANPPRTAWPKKQKQVLFQNCWCKSEPRHGGRNCWRGRMPYSFLYLPVSILYPVKQNEKLVSIMQELWLPEEGALTKLWGQICRDATVWSSSEVHRSKCEVSSDRCPAFVERRIIKLRRAPFMARSSKKLQWYFKLDYITQCCYYEQTKQLNGW